MTAPRGKVSASLASRGRPAMWANEAETCALSGYPLDGVKFRADLPELEKAGFPQVNRRNGMRFIPAILRFWWRQLDSQVPEAPELGCAQDYEDQDESQRLAS